MLLHKEIFNAKYENVIPISGYLSVEQKEKDVFVHFLNGIIQISNFSNGIIKIFIGEPFETSSSTNAVTDNLHKVNCTFSEDDNYIIIHGTISDTYIEKSSLKIAFKSKDGKIICSDFKAAGRRDSNIFISKTNDCLAYYGLGEKGGSLNKKGCYLENYNTDDPMNNDETSLFYKTIPFYAGLKPDNAYGIYFDNSFRSFFDMGKSFKDMIYFGAAGGKIQYYFIPGNDLKDVVHKYSELTGTMELPPKWALGYQQCRYSYASEKEVLNLAKCLRKNKIPCDTIYLDIHYMDKFKVMTFDKNNFNNPSEMLKELHKNGFKVVTILDPGVKVEENYGVYERGLAGDHFIKNIDGTLFTGEVWPGESAFPDFSNTEARQWWKKELKNFISIGIDGIWNDMNEPAVFNNDIKTMPDECIHNSCNGTIAHSEFHNMFGMEMSRCSNEAQEELRPNLRQFSMTRATFAGGQRYSSIWTGDNYSTWEHLRMSIPMNCNLGISGFSFTGNDVGGFGGDCTKELFIRWMELGTFLPIFRNHSAIFTRRQEPWSFGPDAEKICKKAINLRYSLLPYIYNQYYKSYKEGIPVFRPMILDFDDDENVLDMYSQFMFGDNILVAPILYRDEREKLVYFPKGYWYDYFTHKKYEGGKYYTISIPLNNIGVFVKENSIIPVYEDFFNYVGEKELPVTLKLFPGSGSSCYYEDDDTTLEYKKGAYNLYKFTYSNNAEKKINIESLNKGFNKTQDFKTEYVLECN